MDRSVIQGGIRPYKRGGAAPEQGRQPSERGHRSRSFNARKWIYGALGAVVLGIVCLFLFLGPMARWAAHAWVVDEEPKASDAIVVLAGSVSARPYAAAELWNQGYAPLVVVTTMPHGGFMTPGEDYATHAIMSRGVPRESFVVLRTEVTSTYDEAMSVLAWAKDNGVSRILLVTDPFHTRRSRWIFKRLLEPWGIEVITVAAPPKGYDLDHWWDNEFSLVEFPNDVVKYLLYRTKY